MEHRWLKEVHLKLKLVLDNGQWIEAIVFNAIEKYDFKADQEKVKLVYELDKNEYKGSVSLQLKVLACDHKVLIMV